VTVEIFKNRAGNSTLQFEMPILTRLEPAEIHYCEFQGKNTNPDHMDSCIHLSPRQVQFIFSAQHDCRMASLPAISHFRPQMQERHETFPHYKTDCPTKTAITFVLNTHALHNAHLLRRVLPRELVAPKPLYEDRTGSPLRNCRVSPGDSI